MSRLLARLTVWRGIFAILMLGGLYATYLRVRYGLGGSTNLSDQFPWGIWIGFDILCGVGLAAGGFKTCSSPLRKAALITSLNGLPSLCAAFLAFAATSGSSVNVVLIGTF